MLRFEVFHNGRPAETLDLAGAYLVGTDGVPLRSQLRLQRGQIVCEKRTAGPAGLVLPWEIPDLGRVLLETVRVPERDRPYNLHVEMARARLMRIVQKREDWGLFDYAGIEHIDREVQQAQELFIAALKADESTRAAELAYQSLTLATRASEALAAFHADVFLQRRIQSGAFGRRVFGVVLDLNCRNETYLNRVVEGFDFVTLPIHWRDLEAKEQEFNWDPFDEWIDWLSKRRIPIKVTPLVAFNARNIPDWLYIWEHDFETVRDLTYDHIRRVVSRYATCVQAWDVVSGLHAENIFGFTFEQLMELTRMAGSLTKQLAPRSTTIVDLIAPWGEYYAENQHRTIPPMLYADMSVQSGITFDAFGLQFHFGAARPGMYVRDMFQISSMIDRFANLGKAVHISAVQVPSHSDTHAGYWRRPWDEQLQREWVETFYRVALSKPFVETVTWYTLYDRPAEPDLPEDSLRATIPHTGLLRADMSPKPAHRTLRQFRREIQPVGGRPGRVPPAATA